MVSHKAGTLKQPKKQHKHGKHRSKGALSVKAKGRVGAGASYGRKKGSTTKLDRKNKDNQKRRVKQVLSLEDKKELGGPGHAPICVVLLPANPGVQVKHILQSIKDQGEVKAESDNSFVFYCKRLKKRFHFVTPGGQEGLFEQLDLVKCADLVVIVWDSGYKLDVLLKTCLYAQGLPAVQHVVYGDVAHTDRDKIKRNKKMAGVLETYFNASEQKVHYLDSESDVQAMLWGMVNFKRLKLGFIKHRSYVVSSGVDFEQTCETTGTLKVTGYVRGTHLDANQLIHIPGLGHFRIKQITRARDPLKNYTSEMYEEAILSTQTTPAPLEMESPVNEMDAEQTWPTEEDLMEAEKNLKNVKRVPKGTSSYQAVWMLSDESESESESVSEAVTKEEEEEEEEDEEFEDIDTESQAPTEGDYDVDFDEEIESEELRKFRAARDDEAFPDEVDTPIDTPARVRFQKYRGLKSFRTSAWDPKENLPLDYARIWQIHNFRNMRKFILKSHIKEERDVSRGSYVTIWIENVPLSVTESCRSALTIFALLPHEQRMCVQHTAVQRHTQSDLIVKSKDQILAQVGFRRYLVRPIYSTHTKSNKHKLERFMPNTGMFVSSYYAPITFSNSPVVLFKREENGSVTLLATGAMLSCDSDRIVCKRVVLSGHPMKINKRTATIRYLLHNREDIAYFKPIEVKTKHGRRGHIKEALGTHGHMKIGFDGPIQQNDTVILSLYKRVFPKWDFSYS